MLALAQSYAQAPMLVVGGETPKPDVAEQPATDKPIDALSNFPEQAITHIGDAKPEKPAAPAVSKLWPRDTVQIFMPRCTALKQPFIAPCNCVITKLMAAIPHDEFLKKSEDGSIEQDPRLIQIRTDCATAPQRKE